MILPRLLERVRPEVERRASALPDMWPGFVLFFSVSDGKKRAEVVTATGPNFADAWKEGARRTLRAAGAKKMIPRWLRVDWVDSAEQMTWRDLHERLKATKRNYFRHGISLDSTFKHAFLETELNGNAMLYLGDPIRHAALNVENFRRYAALRHNLRKLEFPDEAKVQVFSTQGVFTSGSSPDVHILNGSGRDGGRRNIDRLMPHDVRALIRNGSEYLTSQVGRDGRFCYGWHPCFDRAIKTYNNLRHASSLYSMIEAWEVTRDEQLKAAIDRALDYLTDTLIKTVEVGSAPMAFLVEENAEIKLGGNAVCLLALVKYSELVETDRYHELLERLANGILHMQDRETGKFRHVLLYPSLEVKDEFRIIYYDGEAAFGLMRLYGLTGDPRWLTAVEKAFAHFIEAKHWKAHDHWLSYCVNELTHYKPNEEYYRFGIQNFAGHLDFVIERITTFPTLLELMMAAQKMVARLQGQPEYRHLLDGVDLDKFYRALHARAHYLLNGHFWPELAMFFANPARITGSFFIRHHAFRVRIDDVEHYLSGYVAYLKFLTSGGGNNDSAAERAIGAVEEDDNSSEPARMQRPDLREDAVIAWGGDVNLGRRQHYRTAEVGVENVLDISAFKAADLSIVNLECVVSTRGEAGVEKGEAGPYYYRARPEMLHVLRHAGVDMVAVANNHSGDYGGAALVEQAHWLETFGLKFAGSGSNISEAFRPAYSQAGPFKVAMFSIDATQHRFAATDDSAGIAYLDPKKPELWRQTLETRIAEARSKADIVLVAVHWGNNWATKPDDAEIAVGHAIIDAGADAILGTSAHVLQGMEVYKGKPIIHDAGDLLFDSKLPDRGAGVFRLHLDRKGICAVSFVPVRVAFGRTHDLPRKQAIKVSADFRALCLQLGSDIALEEDGSATLTLREYAGDPSDADRQFQTRHAVSDDAIASALNAIGIRDEWAVTDIPAEARLDEPIRIGPLTLLGLRCKPRSLTGRAMLWVESFWRCEERPAIDWRLDIRAVSNDEGSPVRWGTGMDHDPCDWMLPTSRWQPRQIYRDYFGLRPPASKTIRNTDLIIEVCLTGQNGKTTPIRVPNSVVRIELPSPPAPAARPSFARPAISQDQRQPVPISKCRFSFLNVDMGVQRTGVENASLLRAALFTQELGISPRILTSKYNPQLRYAEEVLRSTGQLPNDVLLRNMYDDYQNADSFDPSKHASVDLLRPEVCPTQEWKPAPNTNDHRVFSQDGQKLMYVARRKDTGKIGYVNHFHSNIKWRRDIYDYRGFLSCVQLLEGPSARVVQETFLRPDGSPALMKKHHQDQNKIDYIQLVNQNGQLKRRLRNDSDLLIDWLDEFCNQDDFLHVLFIDKSRILYDESVDVRDMQSDVRKISIVPIIHAIHTRDYRNIESGVENRNYAGILRDIKRPDALVTMTEEQKSDIIKRYGTAPISAIGHAYSSPIPGNDFEQRDRYKVVYLARYSPEKNHQMAIRAFKAVIDQVPNASLHCHGFGNPGDPTLPALEKLVQELELGSNVFLHGWAQETASIYEGAGLTVITSQAEAFSLTIMESLCHGCPVVGFDVRYGPRALIRNGYNGFLVPFGDETALAQHIVKVLEDETLHRELSSHARQDAARFSPKQMARSWSKLLSSLSIGEDIESGNRDELRLASSRGA